MGRAEGAAASRERQVLVRGVRTYLERHREELEDYRRRAGVVEEGYRGMGAMESNLRVLARRFKGRGMSWTPEGMTHLVKVVELRENWPRCCRR